jgi:transcriptional regulator with XRE-family HTH domain
MSSSPATLIRRTRGKAGLTQAELARLSGTTQSAVARLEAGRATPSVRTLRRLLVAMGRSLDLRTTALDVEESGVDRSLIEYQLAASPAERLRRLRAGAGLVGALRGARRDA